MRVLAALPGILALCLAAPAAAKPMWKIADRWRCTLEMHIKTPPSGKGARFNEERGESIYDFASGTRSSVFVDSVAQIGDRHYYESKWGRFNIIELKWDGESYPVMVVEKDGEYWQTSASGYSDSNNVAWIAAYRCRPDTNS